MGTQGVYFEEETVEPRRTLFPPRSTSFPPGTLGPPPEALRLRITRPPPSMPPLPSGWPHEPLPDGRPSWAAPAAPATRPRVEPVIVGLAGIKTSDDGAGVLVTPALGSSIAVALFDPVLKVGGMIHYALPLSKYSSPRARIEPAMFADTGIPRLFRRMFELGCRKDSLIVKVAGGADLLDESGVFNIGQRNYAVMRKLFDKNHVVIHGEDVGGRRSRILTFDLRDGRVTVHSLGDTIEI